MRLGVNEEQIAHLSEIITTRGPIFAGESKEQFNTGNSFRVGSGTENIFSSNALQQSVSNFGIQHGTDPNFSKVSFPAGTKF